MCVCVCVCAYIIRQNGLEILVVADGSVENAIACWYACAKHSFWFMWNFLSVAWEENKKEIKKESAGLSPAETKELEDLKQAIVERKAILKEQGLSGGQQNKDEEVVKMVARMNELKEKQDWVGLIMTDQTGSVYMVCMCQGGGNNMNQIIGDFMLPVGRGLSLVASWQFQVVRGVDCSMDESMMEIL